MTEEKHRGLRMWREIELFWSHWEPRSVQELWDVCDAPLSEWFTQAGIRPIKAMNAKMLGFVFQCSFDYPSVWDHVRDFSDSLDYDLYYVHEQSFLLDVVILIQTFFFAFKGI